MSAPDGAFIRCLVFGLFGLYAVEETMRVQAKLLHRRHQRLHGTVCFFSLLRGSFLCILLIAESHQ